MSWAETVLPEEGAEKEYKLKDMTETTLQSHTDDVYGIQCHKKSRSGDLNYTAVGRSVRIKIDNS